MAFLLKWLLGNHCNTNKETEKLHKHIKVRGITNVDTIRNHSFSIRVYKIYKKINIKTSFLL